MKRQQVLLLGSSRLRLRSIACELSKIHLSCSHELCFEEACRKLSKIRYEAMLVGQSAIPGQPEAFCSSIHNNDPHMTIVVEITKQNIKLEHDLLDLGVDDVVMSSTPCGIVAKRIFVRLSSRFRPRCSDDKVNLGGALVDFKNLEVWNQGKIKRITPGQAELLRYFIDNAGKIISRSGICESLWAGSVVDPEGKNLDMQVSKIRALIEEDPQKPKIITTIYGVGYRFMPCRYSSS